MPENYINENEDFEFDKNIAQETNPQNTLNRSQVIAVAVLAFFAFLVILLWAWSFKRSINSPFDNTNSISNGQNISNSESTCTGSDCKVNQENLKVKDTDKDGLSDYEELYFYNTSPYLEDSDSDGVRDDKEISAGDDPNCPVGRDCYETGIVDGDKAITIDNAEEGDESNQQSSLNTILNQLGYEQGVGEPSTEPANTQAIEALLGGEIDAPTLRQILVSYGMQKELLDQISDEELMSSFGEVFGQ